MKKTAACVLVAGLLVVGAIFCMQAFADPVEPANLQLTCLRNTGSSSSVSSTTYYQGDTISLTNSVMYTGATTNTPVQNLDGCVITVTAGQPGNTNVTVASGYNISTNNGTWGAEFTVPAFNPCYIEVTVSNNAVFTYPRYRITTQAKLGN